MAKFNDDRGPYDPAKAMRDRANANKPLAKLTKQQRTVRRHGLRPLPAAPVVETDKPSEDSEPT
jgi:hypothetical protein